MSYARSFYADQKPIPAQQQQNQSQQQQQAYAASVPSTTPIAEQPLTPAQIQEAIRTYRTMMSNSAPQSPVAYQPPVEPVRPVVQSNYYGGGPTDIPQSYMVDYNKSTSAASTPINSYNPQPIVAQPIAQVPQVSEAELIARLQNLAVQEPPVAAVSPQFVTKKTVPQQAKHAAKMYDDEESGYCFNRKKSSGDSNFQQDFEYQEDQPIVETSYNSSPKYQPPQQQQAPPQNAFRASLGPSEYIGMSNDSKFIYDAQRACPAAYTANNNYTLVNHSSQNFNSAPAAPAAPQTEEYGGTTTTEDVTQVPASPAVHSRFRGMIQNISSTPTKMTAPIVVERISDSPVYQNYMPNESEYQLPVLNDLASCIEHY